MGCRQLQERAATSGMPTLATTIQARRAGTTPSDTPEKVNLKIDACQVLAGAAVRCLFALAHDQILLHAAISGSARIHGHCLAGPPATLMPGKILATTQDWGWYCRRPGVPGLLARRSGDLSVPGPIVASALAGTENLAPSATTQSTPGHSAAGSSWPT